MAQLTGASPPFSSFSRAAVVLALSVSAAAPALAQSGPEEIWESPTWMGDAAFLSLNALVGGLTAGLIQTLRNGSFQDGFSRGALGGAISYGGRRVAVEEFAGAGLVGRQMSAVGGSVVRNASEGIPALSRLSLPVGPLLLIVDRRTGTHFGAELDFNGTVWLLSALMDDRLKLDGGASLSAGAPVFRTPDHRLGTDGDHPSGGAIAGLILLGYDADYDRGHDVLAHERVHVLQYDFVQEIWGDPLETWVGERVGIPAVLRFIRPGVVYPSLNSAIVDLFDIQWWDRPWEIEAEYLEYR